MPMICVRLKNLRTTNLINIVIYITRIQHFSSLENDEILKRAFLI